jgi:bla regulator protein blaR1
MILKEILPGFSETIGWTLVHSLWQSALVLVAVMIVMRWVPLRLSRLRYAIACSGVVASVVIACATFFFYNSSASPYITHIPTSTPNLSLTQIVQSSEGSASVLESGIATTMSALNENMPIIVAMWAVGMLVFSLRLFTGWWTINRLKSDAVAIVGFWHDQLCSLAKQLGIDEHIMLAENPRITTPMVIGFLKPIVLVPTGMLTGLSTEQIETIFVHELAHIKRYDYIINLLQVLIETIFFFNPFVWIMSNIIRREREYCCDDDVVKIHGGTLAYAHALAQLEEWKLSKSTFALALAANKNQLLNRIKRIMEKSGQNYSGKDRFIPAVLLIVGLVCASWLTVQKKESIIQADGETTIKSDTTIKTEKSSRATIITFDENGKAHEQVFEEGNNDSDVFTWAPVVPPTPPDLEIDAVPAVPWTPAAPGIPADTWITRSMFSFDTIPGPALFNRSGRNWERLSKEFEERFSAKFEDFYKNHEKDFDNMMKEMEAKFKADFEAGQMVPLEMQLAELAQLESLQAVEHLDLQEMQLAQEHALAAMESIPMIPAIAELDQLTANLADLQHNLNGLEDEMQKFQQELKESLIADGYLKKGEEIKSMKWEDDAIEINGKKMKDSDVNRYHKKHDKFFDNDFHVNRIE